MKQMTTGRATTVLSSLVGLGILILASGWSHAQDPLQDVEKRLTEKRTAAETHRKQMEGVKDPEKLSTEMRRHFQMTEELLALMLERQQLLKAQAPASGTPSGPGSGMQGGGMQGGMMEHGMGMRQKEMGGMQGGGMQGGGMRQKEMGGMQGGSMQGMGASGQQASGTPGGPATPGHDLAQMMQRITEHSTYMETLKDQTTLAQEMLRHQKMLDEMLQLMQ